MDWSRVSHAMLQQRACSQAISRTHLSLYLVSDTARDLSNCGKRVDERCAGFM
jgi:hypothetical protein